MSHANGQCRFKDGTVLHFEYNGTTGLCLTRLFQTSQLMRENWRDVHKQSTECTCGQESESVELAVDYGNGFYNKDGKACKSCKAITFDPWCEEYLGSNDYIADDHTGLPVWWI